MRPALVLLLGLMGIVAWGFGDLFTTNSVLGYISPFHHELPEKAWFYSNLIKGHLAWVYPFNDLGLSLMGDPTVSIAYLPSLLYAWWPVAASKLLLICHYLLLGFGLYRWISRSLPHREAVGATLLISSCGVWWSLPEHVALGFAAFVPWSVLAWKDFWQTPSHRHAILAGFFSGMMFILGDPFLVPFAFILALPHAPKLSSTRYAPTALGIFLLVAGANLSEMLILIPHGARAAGLTRFEILSYSTHPGRVFEMVLPWIKWSFPLGEGFHRQWWFPRVGFGIILTALIVLGSLRWRQNAVPLLLAVGLLLLSFGQFFAPSAWLFEHVLNFIRFPERFLLYFVFATVPLIASGLSQFPWRSKKLVLLFLVTLGLAENLLPRPLPDLADAQKLDSLKNSLITQVAFNEAILPSRVWACQHGVSGNSLHTYWDLGAYGVAMANAESSTLPQGLKVLSCPSVLSEENRRWLGTGILLTAPTSPQEKEILKFWQWRQTENTEKGEVWRSDDASPLLAWWMPGPNTPCAGSLLMESTIDWQKLSFAVPKGCHGLIALPWSYHPHSRAVYFPARKPISAKEIRSATLGFIVPQDAERIEVIFERPYALFLLTLSLLAQLILGSFLLSRSFLPLRKKSP